MSDQALAIFGEKTDQMPAYLESSTSSLGNENMSQEDMAIPYIKLLQKMSPELDEVEGAKAGQFYNTVTSDLYDSIFVLNLHYSKEWTIFKKQDLGGGFQGSAPTKAAAMEVVETLPGSPDNYDVIETARHTCLLLDDEGAPVQPVQILMKSTGLSVSRKWNSDISTKSGGNVDRFATVWRVSSQSKSNDKGTWSIWKIEFAGWAPEELHSFGKDTYTSIAESL